MYYDPLGRVVKTVNADNTEQRVVYGVPNSLTTPDNFSPTPWENYAYDANDLSPITNTTSNPVPSAQWFTPKSSEVDALGRTVKTTEHKVQINGSNYEDIVMQYQYDVRGNLLLVKDPYNRNVFEHVYDLRTPEKDQALTPLYTKHIDKGIGTVLLDALGKPIEGKDAKGALTLSAYDTLQRSAYGWARNDGSSNITLRSFTLFGDTSGTGATDNVNGKPFEIFDEAGKLSFTRYDFKGNILNKTREVIDDSVLKGALSSYTNYIMDWDSPPALATLVFTTDMRYDALNRIRELELPQDLNSERKKIIPTYNRAGALEKVDLYIPTGSKTTNYVTLHI
jgi:hypothetical protein